MTCVEPLQYRRRISRPLLCVAISCLFTNPCARAQLGAPEKPMQPIVGNGAEYRWLQKKVLDSRLLDGMEDNRDHFAATRCVCYYPYVEREVGEGKGLRVSPRNAS